MPRSRKDDGFETSVIPAKAGTQAVTSSAADAVDQPHRHSSESWNPC